MKTIKKIIAVVLSGFICFSMFACNKKKDPDTENVLEVERANFQGVHSLSCEDTDKWLVKDGKTDYTLVVPAAASSIMSTIQSEFVLFFKKATGISLRVKMDTGLTHQATDKYISLGETTLVKSAEISIDKSQLGMDGVRIETKDNNIYICGGSDYGTLFGVYTFLELTFNFEAYFSDCIVIDENVVNKKLKNYQVTDIPDFDIRAASYGFQRREFLISEGFLDDESLNFPYRQKLIGPYWNFFMNINEKLGVLPNNAQRLNAGSTHNCAQWLPFTVYSVADAEYNDTGKAHPLWYSDKKANSPSEYQLCYTAHGDEKELDAMVIECAKKLVNSMIDYDPIEFPLVNAVTLTIEDNQYHCPCDACKKSKEVYGADSAAILLFCNRVMEEVSKWINGSEDVAKEITDMINKYWAGTAEWTGNVKDYYRDDFNLSFFAYVLFEEAPVTYDSNTQSYKPNAPEIKARDDVGVFIALMDNVENQKSIYDPINADARRIIESWASIIRDERLYFWLYSTNFASYLTMFDCFDHFCYDEGYNYYASQKAKMMHSDSEGLSVNGATGFSVLRAYLQAKLQWNCNLDAQELTNKYFNAMYKDAAPIMKRLFQAQRLHFANLNTTNNTYQLRSHFNFVENDSKNFPYETLRAWLKLCDEAYVAVEKYKAIDPVLYQALIHHIDFEWVSPAYLMLLYYQNHLSAQELVEMKAKFKYVVEYCDIENTTASKKLIDFTNSF